MVENVGRKLLLIGTLVGVSLVLLLLPQTPLQMGLDLNGGTRLLYELDIESARRDGTISEQETDAEVMEAMIEIIRDRVDPDGIKEPVIRRAGGNRVEISVPGTSLNQGAPVTGNLGDALTAESTDVITLDPGLSSRQLTGFAAAGGTVGIGDEHVSYTSRSENLLLGIVRGVDNTTAALHDPGAAVTLLTDDSIQNRIENLGNLRFMIASDPSMLATMGTDEARETTKLTDWLDKLENAAASFRDFNEVSPEAGGPTAGLFWATYRSAEAAVELAERDRPRELLVIQPPEWDFTGDDVDRLYKTQDTYGLPAVGFQMKPETAGDFTDFTSDHVDDGMAILLNGEIATLATINETLPGGGQISGRFTDREVDEMITVLRSGSLPIKPQLVDKEQVSATVGADYVRRGLLGGGVALLVTMLFMMAYYRRLGVFAAIGLACNLTMLLGIMVLLQATLTLPGIAGMILTIGMAVDANILIFDRIREERELGRNPLQSIKNGFAQALSAIVDSNVTTLLAALILYNVGTGPVRGFAVTLAIGVLTSMFAALVIVRVLVHLDVERQKKLEPYKMGRWLADANFDLFKYTKLAVPISLSLIVLGLIVFSIEPREKKYGIDFLGGSTVKVRTEQGVGLEEMRSRVSSIPGTASKAEVLGLPASQLADDTYREFRITAKGQGEQTDTGQSTLERDLRLGLTDLLQLGPVEVALTPGPERAAATIALYLEESHPAADIEGALATAGFLNPKATVRDELGNVFDVQGEVSLALNDGGVRDLIESAFKDKKDSGGKAFEFSTPVPESSVVHGQVVGELRDSALRALLLSLFVTVLYIRVRFAEYSYGIAAVCALLHDVLFTLGAVAFLIWFPLIDIEINLPLIAAFLTIVGYSINDTIVVFDRVRENRPKLSGTLKEVVNRSLNQTLSRTIMTSGTTLVTILIVLLFNLGTGSVIEGFAFAMFFGMTVGTYSSIFIASPIFIKLEARAQRRDSSAASPATTAPNAS